MKFENLLGATLVDIQREGNTIIIKAVKGVQEIECHLQHLDSHMVNIELNTNCDTLAGQEVIVQAGVSHHLALIEVGKPDVEEGTYFELLLESGVDLWCFYNVATDGYNSGRISAFFDVRG